MLHGNILVSHLLGLILSAQQCLVQVLADIRLAAGHLGSSAQRILHTPFEMLLVNLHFLNQFPDQAVLLGQQTVQQVLLLDFLIAIFIGDFLTFIDCLKRFLRKFTDVHKISSLSLLLHNHFHDICFLVLFAL